MVLTFKSANEVQKYDHSNLVKAIVATEQYFLEILFQYYDEEV